MKNLQNKLTLLLFIAFTFPHLGASEDRLINEFDYEVNQVYPYVSITTEKLNQAETLLDLNKRYQTSWVEKYISVEVLTTYKGKLRKVISKNDKLTTEQKNSMKTADTGTDISVKVQYMPKNTLTENEPKEINFTFSVNPDNQAKYAKGEKELNQYLKEQAIDKIPKSIFKEYQLTAVKFTIDEKGKVTNAHIFESSKDEAIDKLLVETIQNMSSWKPASYANGVKVKQDFVFTIGDHRSCVINLLSIGRLL